MTVQIEVGWDFEVTLTLFRKMLMKDGILKEVRTKDYAMSRSQRRKAKDLTAAKRTRRREYRRGDGHESKRVNVPYWEWRFVRTDDEVIRGPVIQKGKEKEME